MEAGQGRAAVKPPDASESLKIVLCHGFWDRLKVGAGHDDFFDTTLFAVCAVRFSVVLALATPAALLIMRARFLAHHP
ncbi:hypothetical protein BGE01nite_22930 [Brevifollis gellanilyticus]|uniref:Uncharacterized protein n=1 Tax=Brevifollis gellanilyticus TaxID=748831 RepID=A0A512M8F6_9BACT|nr:hypothetical protein BGE01nite_22930 [Brevifollis gellanilyticus]